MFHYTVALFFIHQLVKLLCQVFCFSKGGQQNLLLLWQTAGSCNTHSIVPVEFQWESKCFNSSFSQSFIGIVSRAWCGPQSILLHYCRGFKYFPCEVFFSSTFSYRIFRNGRLQCCTFENVFLFAD